MAYKDIKARLITCLKSGTYDHEMRKNINVKNLFQCGLVNENFVITLLELTHEADYEQRVHHKAPEIDIHIFMPNINGTQWYVKCYFLQPKAVFISVHESGVK